MSDHHEENEMTFIPSLSLEDVQNFPFILRADGARDWVRDAMFAAPPPAR